MQASSSAFVWHLNWNHQVLKPVEHVRKSTIRPAGGTTSGTTIRPAGGTEAGLLVPRRVRRWACLSSTGRRRMLWFACSTHDWFRGGPARSSTVMEAGLLVPRRSGGGSARPSTDAEADLLIPLLPGVQKRACFYVNGGGVGPGYSGAEAGLLVPRRVRRRACSSLDGFGCGLNRKQLKNVVWPFSPCCDTKAVCTFSAWLFKHIEMS